ncbi:MAG: hypothetical protein EOM80_12195 [Erysipelotrichia bacterium]|nr:hypothetical protein [Erysipelotrichia bacterium]
MVLRFRHGRRLLLQRLTAILSRIARPKGTQLKKKRRIPSRPWLGKTPVGEITPPEILSVLRRVELRGAVETAHTGCGYISKVICFAIAAGWWSGKDAFAGGSISELQRGVAGIFFDTLPMQLERIFWPG